MVPDPTTAMFPIPHQQGYPVTVSWHESSNDLTLHFRLTGGTDLPVQVDTREALSIRHMIDIYLESRGLS